MFLVPAVVAGATVGEAPSASAAGSGCSNHDNYFAGAASTHQSSIFGAQAQIEYRIPALCSPSGGSPSDSSAWSMVTAENLNTPGYDYYAQIGYIKVGADANEYAIPSGNHIFSEYTKACYPSCGSAAPVVQQYTAAPSGAVMYTNVLRSSDNRIHMLWDGHELSVTSYNPAGDWNSAWQAQYFAETQHPQTDVVGTATNKATFNYLQRIEQNGDINFFQSLPNQCEESCSQSTSRYHIDTYNASVGGIGMTVWTNPL